MAPFYSCQTTYLGLGNRYFTKVKVEILLWTTMKESGGDIQLFLDVFRLSKRNSCETTSKTRGINADNIYSCVVVWKIFIIRIKEWRSWRDRVRVIFLLYASWIGAVVYFEWTTYGFDHFTWYTRATDLDSGRLQHSICVWLLQTSKISMM